MSTSYGWAGKLLFVDFSSGRIEARDTAPYAAETIGGHNLACRIGWDELPDGVQAFDPDSILTIITGPLSGTTAPFSGRTTVSGLSPQGWPHEWFSRSSFGGHWGPTLKYAGFDGLVIRGRAPEPVYLWIDDGRVEIRSAGHLWGLGIFETQQRLMEEHGRSTRILAIGPAGEHRSRIAVISTGTASAAGQGGYGGVMGSKNLKAINSSQWGLSWDQIRLVGEKVYGSSLATDPESGYAYKAEPAVWHKKRSMLKDSLTVDDNVFPRLFSRASEDGYARAAGMEGPQFEWHLFRAATGSEMSVEEFDRCAERATNLERALQIRHFGRRRQDDEGIIPYLETEENLVNPFLGSRQSLDREQFLVLMDRYYDLSGWDRETGWPTREKLLDLGLQDVADRLYPAAEPSQP
jgi:aldehyde:ferredoxin oxidoreductase